MRTARRRRFLFCLYARLLADYSDVFTVRTLQHCVTCLYARLLADYSDVFTVRTLQHCVTCRTVTALDKWPYLAVLQQGHVGASGRLGIRRPFKQIFFEIFRPKTGLGNTSGGNTSGGYFRLFH